MTNNELLAEAKRKYPKGTVYIAAHINTDCIKCTVTNPDNFYFVMGSIMESAGNEDKNGHSYCEVIYEGDDTPKRWAIIVKASVVDEYEIY